MATEIIQECIFPRKAVYDIKLLLQQACILGCDTVPCGRHGCYVVKHMAFRLFYRTKVRNYLLRFHNYFSEKCHTRADDLTDYAHHTDDGMYLRQISALGSELFPDIRNRIDSDNVHSLICEEQEIIHHFVKHPRILVIQIPLIRIKCRHYKMSCFRHPSEIAWCSCRKHLRYRFFKFSRNIIIVIEEITAHIFSVAVLCLYCPFMIFGSVIHYKVHAEIHLSLMTILRQIRQIRHGSKLGLHLAEIGNRISSVRFSFRRIQERHQMNTVYIT